MVFSAGNDGSTGKGSVTSPGLGKNMLTVGATRNAYASFSEVFNTYFDYEWIRQDYNIKNCNGTCSSGGGCCMQSEADCCDGVGFPIKKRFLGCCKRTLLSNLKSNKNAWQIFSQDTVAAFSSIGPVFGG